MSLTTPVRVRFAPTPTGNIPIVKLRAALVNWLFARQHNGVSVLRIDDLECSATDSCSYESLVEDLHWLGLNYDEGANKIGGAYGPYFQSQRISIYKPFIRKLIREKSAYRCFCVPEDIEVATSMHFLRTSACRADCASLPIHEVDQRLREGSPYVVRLSASGAEIIIRDMIQGQLSFRGDVLGDFIFAGSGEYVSPEFASAIDDCLMMISHVIRGEHFMSRTPRQILICKALDLEPPIFGHLTPVADADGVVMHTESEFATVDWLRKEGFFPEPVLGFVARLAGMVLPSEQRPTLDNLLAKFDVSQILTPQAVFDIDSLKDENEKEIKLIDENALIRCAIPYLLKVGFSENDARIPQIIALYRDNVRYLSELARKASIFVKYSVPLSDKLSSQFIRKDASQKVLWSFKREVASVGDLNASSFRRIMSTVKQETGILGYDLWTPVRVAITGEMDGPDLPQIAELLGKEKCLNLVSTILG